MANSRISIAGSINDVKEKEDSALGSQGFNAPLSSCMRTNTRIDTKSQAFIPFSGVDSNNSIPDLVNGIKEKEATNFGVTAKNDSQGPNITSFPDKLKRRVEILFRVSLLRTSVYHDRLSGARKKDVTQDTLDSYGEYPKFQFLQTSSMDNIPTSTDDVNSTASDMKKRQHVRLEKCTILPVLLPLWLHVFTVVEMLPLQTI